MSREKLKIKTGDDVVVITGKDKGATGKVLKVLPAERRLVVEGINVVKKHQRPTQVNPKGGIIEKERSIHISNVAVADPKDGKMTRVGYKTLKNGDKVRYAKRSGETLD